MTTVYTHNGIFHSDEVMACAIISLVEGIIPSIIRTRDRGLLDSAKSTPSTFVVDVGGEYNVGFRNFDHHQDRTMTKSSAGLVWEVYGQKLCNNVEVFSRVTRLIDQIDAVDLGLAKDRGNDRNYSLIDCISSFNANWNEDQSNQDERFLEAIEFVKRILERKIASETGAVEAKELAESALSEIDENGIITLQQFFPWQEEICKSNNARFVIFLSQTGDTWMVQAVPESKDSFKSRVPLPSNWWALRDVELSEVSGISDCVFCHANGFVGGHKTKDGAIAMALAALRQ